MDAASFVMGSGGRLQRFVSQSGKEWFVSHSRRLTCSSRTLEEKCIIHPVDWSLFFSSGWIRERGWRTACLMDLPLQMGLLEVFI